MQCLLWESFDQLYLLGTGFVTLPNQEKVGIQSKHKHPKQASKCGVFTINVNLGLTFTDLEVTASLSSLDYMLSKVQCNLLKLELPVDLLAS